MADSAGSGSAQSRTVPPSARRLREARQRGDAPRSPLATAALTWLGVTLLASLFGREALTRLHRLTLLSVTELGREPSEALAHAFDVAAPLIALPAGAAVLLGGLGAALVARPVPSLEAVSVEMSRLDPVRGLARLFSWRSLGERALGGLLALLVLAVAGWSAFGGLQQTLGRPHATLASLLDAGAETLGGFGARSAGLLLVAGLLAAVYRSWRWWKDHHMTRDEARQEQKRAEGDPTTRARHRRRARRHAEQRSRAEAMARAALVIRGGRLDVALEWSDPDATPRIDWVGAPAPLSAAWVEDEELAAALARVGVGRAVPRERWRAVAAHLGQLERAEPT